MSGHSAALLQLARLRSEGSSSGATSATSTLLASASKDRSIRLWKIETVRVADALSTDGGTDGGGYGASLNAVPLGFLGPASAGGALAHRDVVRALAVVGSDLYSTGRDKTLRLWRRRTEGSATSHMPLSAHEEAPAPAPAHAPAQAPAQPPAQALAQAPAQAPAQALAQDAVANDAHRWLCARSLAAHTDEVLALAAEPHGAWPHRAPLQLGGSAGLLFTASRSGELRIWDRESLVCLDAWPVHANAIHALLVRRDLLISASGDGTIKVHRAAPARCKEQPPQTA